MKLLCIKSMTAHWGSKPALSGEKYIAIIWFR